VEKFCGSIPPGIVRFTGTRQTLNDCETTGNATATASTAHATSSTETKGEGGNLNYGYKYIADKYKNGGLRIGIPILSVICLLT
jgi:hypothetical protein